MAFPCEHTTRGQAAGEGMPLRPLRAGLTATQAAWPLTYPAHLFALGPDAGEPPALRSRPGQTVGGVVLGAVSDDQDFEVSWQPAGGAPIGRAPIRPNRGTVDATVLLQAADNVPAIVAQALQQGCRWISRVEEHIVGATAPSMASIAQPRQGQGGR